MPHPIRRVAALFMGVMMLVLVLAESGFACAMPDMSASAPAGEMGAMAGMAGMAGLDAPASTVPAQEESEPPCRFPWAPAGCRDMAPCAPATLAAAAWQPEGCPAVRETQRAVCALAPTSFGTPPELPPPRA